MKLLHIAFLFIVWMFLFSASDFQTLLAQEDDDVFTEAPSKPIVYSSENTRTTQYTLTEDTASTTLEVWVSFNPRYKDKAALFKSFWQGLSNVHIVEKIAAADFVNHQDAVFYMQWTDYRVESGEGYTFNIYKSVSPNRLNISKSNTTNIYSGNTPYYYMPSTILSASGATFYWIEIITPDGKLQVQTGFMQMSAGKDYYSSPRN